MSEPASQEPTPVSEPSRSWGDLPPAEQGAIWNETVPGSAERMIRQIEAEYEHRRRMDRIDVWFRAAGVATAAAGIAGFMWIAKYFVDHGAAAAAAGLLGSGVIAALAARLAAQRQK
ncbi:DUF2335 domain-containing protein [Streptomyces sp. NPDC001401]|uniref:DUF2335 domain-containing protein n=1 Tax=Streptomyces sp. NPDC001401 TaxID=3364570 RepID=UPI003678B91D